MNNCNSSLSRNRNNEGIALVIVLGLLAVLVVLGVAFSISMRTERMATRSFVDVVKARQLVHTAINRVLAEDIPNALEDSVYPPWDAIGSGTANEIELLGDRTVNSGNIFIPGSLKQETFFNDNVEWLPLLDPVDNTFYGEYAYLVVNCSGLLDANVIGEREDQGTPRLNGINPHEIRFSPTVLPDEINPLTANRNLKLYRNEFKRFESVPELYYLTSTTSFEADIGVRPLLQTATEDGPWADNLHVFSRFPLGYSEVGLRSTTNVAYIGESAADWNIDSIRGALSDLENPNNIPDVDAFIGAMYDYADEGFELYPIGGTDDEKFARISSKPVPMINEIVVSNTLKLVLNGAQQVLEHRVYVAVETWYPFDPDSDNPKFTVELTAPPEVPQFGPPYPSFMQTPVPEAGPIPVDFNPSVGNGYNVTRYVYLQKQDVNGPGQLPYRTNSAIFAANIQFDGNFVVKYTGSGTPTVDAVLGPFNPTSFRLTGANPALTVGAPEGFLGEQGLAVNDPRINWDPVDPDQWDNILPYTLLDRNDPRISANTTDEFDFMYARRAPFVSVGEVGFLLYDKTKPWETVRLIGDDPPTASPVIDRLTADVSTNYPKRGLVNFNTRQTNAITATIWSMPIRKHPNDARTDLTQAKAQAIARHIVRQTQTLGPITNLSQLAQRLDPGVIDTELGIANDKFTRESVVRNSLGLWSPRQQLFTILVAARTFSEVYDHNDPAMHADRDKYATADQRGVAVVWRDPLETESVLGPDTHKSYIQFFHWFNGAYWDE